jgi:hypothetical protein
MKESERSGPKATKTTLSQTVKKKAQAPHGQHHEHGPRLDNARWMYGELLIYPRRLKVDALKQNAMLQSKEVLVMVH